MIRSIHSSKPNAEDRYDSMYNVQTKRRKIPTLISQVGHSLPVAILDMMDSTMRLAGCAGSLAAAAVGNAFACTGEALAGTLDAWEQSSSDACVVADDLETSVEAARSWGCNRKGGGSQDNESAELHCGP